MRREEKEETGREGDRGNTRRNGNGGKCDGGNSGAFLFVLFSTSNDLIVKKSTVLST